MECYDCGSTNNFKYEKKCDQQSERAIRRMRLQKGPPFLQDHIQGIKGEIQCVDSNRALHGHRPVITESCDIGAFEEVCGERKDLTALCHPSENTITNEEPRGVRFRVSRYFYTTSRGTIRLSACSARNRHHAF